MYRVALTFLPAVIFEIMVDFFHDPQIIKSVEIRTTYNTSARCKCDTMTLPLLQVRHFRWMLFHVQFDCNFIQINTQCCMPTCSVEIAKIYIIAIKENQSPSIQNVVPAKTALP